jgi:DNA-binding IclR family transcriptional regulator
VNNRYEERRDRVIESIKELVIASRGGSPSMRDISDRCGVPLSTLHGYISRLEAEGVIMCGAPGRHRRVRLNPELLNG